MMNFGPQHGPENMLSWLSGIGGGAVGPPVPPSTPPWLLDEEMTEAQQNLSGRFGTQQTIPKPGLYRKSDISSRRRKYD